MSDTIRTPSAPDSEQLQAHTRLQTLQASNAQAARELTARISDLGSMAGLTATDTHAEHAAASGHGHSAAPREILFRLIHKLEAACSLPVREDVWRWLEEQDCGGTEDAPLAGAEEILSEYARRAGWRTRTIELDRDIHMRSSQPLLAFSAQTGCPLLLFPKASGGTFYDPRTDTMQPLHADISAGLARRVWCLYEPFPGGELSEKKLLRFIFAQAGSVLVLLCVVGAISALLGLISPPVTQYITGSIIPAANYSELEQLAILLIVLTACSAGFQLVPSLTLLVFGTRQYERFQAALFDHFLRVPVDTYRMCSAGDMAQRLMGAASIQTTVFSVITRQFLGAIFQLASLAMMFWYSPKLALPGMFLAVIYAAGIFLLARVNRAPLAVHAASAGRLTGLLRQFLEGMGKIRAAVAEPRILNHCMAEFAVQTKAQYTISRNTAIQGLFSMAFPSLVSMLFYVLIGGVWRGELDLPAFMAFMAAFQGFQAGMAGIAGGMWTLLAIRPDVERILPLLRTLPENAAGGEDPGLLDGQVELSHVSFQYQPDQPLVLDDVSLTVKPGEFVAIAGPSGSGKSTLVRLLLGFSRPKTGAVLYSGRDLADLDVRAVRRQLGVILQSSKVVTGSILENIIIGTRHTLADAWQALEGAAMADTVRKMPMGIHTVVSPETISGGQQQRILIARALAGQPALLILDESTSALDNVAQNAVKAHLDRLGTTRIVIAHRLSTIVNADRIYVLDKGRIVQCGTCAELSAEEGLFRTLIRRQQTEARFSGAGDDISPVSKFQMTNLKRGNE